MHYANPAARVLLNDDPPLRIQPGAKGEVLSSDRTDCLTSITRMVQDLCRKTRTTGQTELVRLLVSGVARVVLPR